MEKNVYFVGVDVDDKAYHFSIVSPEGETIASRIKCKRDAGALVKGVNKFTKNKVIMVGYEATYLGYSLQRKLNKLKIACQVIAPTSIAKAPGDRVKNDGKDSFRLALGLWRREFSFVGIPTLEQESDRMVLRSRAYLVSQRSDTKRHILSQCRLLDIDYKQETANKDYWTKMHRDWLDKKIISLPTSAHIMLTVMIQNLQTIEKQIATLESEIEHIATKPEYSKTVQTLNCFKGIATISAMVIVTEIFDINRFEHPSKLVSYMGLDIAEHSSGGKQNQFGITKMGNKRLRTTLVEACQMFSKSKTPSKRKIAIRKGVDKKIISIADRCQERLYTKGHRLLAREKPRNKVKVACAREMVGFIWEAMRLVA